MTKTYFIPKFSTRPHCTSFSVLILFPWDPASVLSIQPIFFAATTVTHAYRQTAFLILLFSLSRKKKRKGARLTKRINQDFTPPKTQVWKSGTDTLNYSNSNCSPEILHGDKMTELRTSVRKSKLSSYFSTPSRRFSVLLRRSQICDASSLFNAYARIYEVLFTGMCLTTYEHGSGIRPCVVYSNANSLFLFFGRIETLSLVPMCFVTTSRTSIM